MNDLVSATFENGLFTWVFQAGPASLTAEIFCLLWRNSDTMKASIAKT
ncbi:MAG: hypothetical protein KGZ73_09345 [Rhizobiales bacterium]|nr:hypothetical protein [Hyphomicrobiales bacterium]